jgi:hypothetical protein
MNIQWWNGKRAGDEFITQRVLVADDYVAVALGSGIAPGDLWEDVRQRIEEHGWVWTCEVASWATPQKPETAPPSRREEEALALAKQKLGDNVGLSISAAEWRVECRPRPGVHGRRVSGRTPEELVCLLTRLPDFNVQLEAAMQSPRSQPSPLTREAVVRSVVALPSGGFAPKEPCVEYKLAPTSNTVQFAWLTFNCLIEEDPHWKIGQKIKITIEDEP